MADAFLRLFVACELRDDVLRALAQIQDDLRRRIRARLRWTRPEGIHLTLKFLGEVDAARVDAIRAALERAIAPFELRLRLDGVGNFGGNRMRVLWAGLEGDVERLAQLAAAVDIALEPLGFPREQRPFSPHLTLARLPDHLAPPDRREVARVIEGYRPRETPSMTLTRVSLMRSILGRGGAVYDRVADFPRP